MATSYELKRLSNLNCVIKLSESEAELILKTIIFLSKHMRTYFHYQVVKRNLLQLLRFIDACQNDFEHSDILECNRLLLNFVDTFYSYINYFESQYKTIFSKIKAYFYDNYLEYAFIYKVRNYAIHEDLPVHKKIKVFFEDRIESKFVMLKQILLNSTRFSKEFKKRLEVAFAGNEEIDLFEMVVQMPKIILEIQKQMLLAVSAELIECFEVLKKYVKKEEVYLMKNGEIHNGLLNVLNKYYQCMADNFVYIENLLDTENVGNLFAKLSTIYYGRADVIYQSPLFCS